MSMLPSITRRAAPFVFILISVGARVHGQHPLQDVPACKNAEYRQFDFWLGDWDVFESDGTTRAAHVRVERALDGCALYEFYEDPSGLRGQSVSLYDRARNVWHQTWVTNRGQLLSIEGRADGREMRLSGSYRGAGGENTQVKATWKPEGRDVRETAATSIDGGKTWKTWFDLVFRPASTAQTNDDVKIVANLDTEYQAAVKHNDATTMDRILADDFVLVTGSGKVQTKGDLLEEARGARTTYERQEDSDQVVRVWGNTAVVTARLTAKGTTDGKAFEYALWFSDTYVRTTAGWRYVFGQASLPLTKTP
jgi:ketosteroid isomerase-like protein